MSIGHPITYQQPLTLPLVMTLPIPTHQPYPQRMKTQQGKSVTTSVTSSSCPPLRLGTSSLSSPLVFGSVLAAIWSVHWRHIFDEVPFTVTNVLATVNKVYPVLHDEARLLPHSSL
ncbi:hypothetical protein DM01DRAFT_1405188 [Hesseltinella vesiculosa]|uniref:Uncharacterized protein n=1 Tax=Hesseltinella vesiculosa TaxID=101127 RepID=A0A1X2GRJ5_9FUNG|nr:hypothetical protein DM01DRAFT_1405188 [Hesseltinella vesiculosa]